MIDFTIKQLSVNYAKSLEMSETIRATLVVMDNECNNEIVAYLHQKVNDFVEEFGDSAYDILGDNYLTEVYRKFKNWYGVAGALSLPVMPHQLVEEYDTFLSRMKTVSLAHIDSEFEELIKGVSDVNTE